MKYIQKISLMLLAFTLIFSACDTEESLNFTSPEPEFVLNSPGISTVFLNYDLPDNPAFTITWKDEVTGSSSYEIEIAKDQEFTTPVKLGTSDSMSFSMTVMAFNEAINSMGISNFRDVPVYVRVKGGDTISNHVLLLVTTYPVNAPEFTLDANTYTLTLAQNNDVALTATITDPILDSNLGVTVNYYLEGATPNTNFAAPLEIATVKNEKTISVTHAQLNKIAQESGIAPDTTGDLEIRLKSVVTNSTGGMLERITTPTTIKVTTYLTVLDLSTTWGIVGDATVNGWSGPDMPFFKTDVNGILNAYVTLKDGEIKFRENNDWVNNFGDNGADGTLDAGGDNIKVTAGSYKIVLNLNTKTYTIEPFSLGIVGGAAPNGWNGPDVVLNYDQYSDVFRGITTLTDGEIKFRMNNDWAVNYGDNGADGTLEKDGANIVVSQGNYIVSVNLNDNTYTLEKIDNIWGLVGSATTNGWNGPDMMLTRDWSRPFDDIWVIKNANLTSGDFKFRANNAWTINYGDDGADGTLEAGGANITTTAGSFTITLDFSDPANPTYTKQ